jgi:predicted flap endonuclease-1-like 5' DNA nuclease
MPVVTSRDDWPVVRHSGGPDLVRVQIGPHSYVKQRPPKEDKMRRSQADKREKPKEDKAEEITQPADDFTELPGVGMATAEALQEHGIHTFDELMQADVSFLSTRAREVVEAWRNG